MTAKPHPQTSEDAGPNLLPCPFCGGPAARTGLDFIACQSDDCFAPKTTAIAEDAVAQWNNRASFTLIEIARQICRASADVSCVMDDHPERPQCDAENCRMFQIAAKAVGDAKLVAQPPQPTVDVGELLTEPGDMHMMLELGAAAIAREGFPKGRESARDYRLRLARAVLESPGVQALVSRSTALALEVQDWKLAHQNKTGELEAAEQSLRTAREALKPFARHAAFYENADGGTFIQARLQHSGLTATEFCTVNALRTARAALTGAGEK